MRLVADTIKSSSQRSRSANFGTERWSPSGARSDANGLEASIQSTTIVPVTDALLDAVAELRYRCRLLGHPLHDRAHGNDLWIAASALEHGAGLLTRDAHFAHVDGLRCGRRLEDFLP